MGDNILLPLYAVAGVYLLWVLETLLRLPVAVEDVFKAVLMYVLVKNSTKKSDLTLVILIGISFSVSESLFYLFNYLGEGNLIPLLLRVITTAPMHLFTFVWLYMGIRRGSAWGLVALLASIGLHYWFNGLAL